MQNTLLKSIVMALICTACTESDKETALLEPEETAAQDAIDAIEGGYPYDEKGRNAISKLADKVNDIQSNPFSTVAELIELGREVDRVQHPNLPAINYPKVSAEELDEGFSTVKHHYALSLEQYDLGQIEEAINSTKKMVQAYEKILGKNSENLLITLGNLGFFYTENEEFEKAEAVYQRRLNIVRMRHGEAYEDSYHYAIVLESLMGFYVEIFEYAKARPLAEQTLKTYEKHLGPNHRNNGTVLVKLGEIYQAESEDEKAEEFLLRAVNLYENIVLKDEETHELHVEALLALSTFYEVSFYTKSQNSKENFEHIWDKAVKAEEDAKRIAVIFLGENSE